MRVIAGSAKGTKLGPVPEGTRPMTDRAREGLFSSLWDRVIDARVLDLYAGTGAVGIEALSRGAEHATFVDQAPGAVTAIMENLRRTHLEEHGTPVRTGVLSYLGRAPEQADLVFVDAPYQLEPSELDTVLAKLATGWLTSEDGPWTVMLSRSPKGYMPVIPINWGLAKRLDYGDTKIYLYQEG